MSNPTISIVMAVHNGERTIRAAIESVLAQTFSDFELIICDDASTDNTKTVVRSFADNRVVLLCNENNMGPGPSRDRAIAIAKGLWVTVLDADDAYAPKRLEVLLGVAKQYPDTVVFDEIMECHDTDGEMVPWQPIRSASVYLGVANQIREVSIANWISQRRLTMVPFLPIHYIKNCSIRHADVLAGEDIAFRLRLLARTKAPLWYVPAPLYYYRLNSGSLSTRSDSTRLLIQVLESAAPEFAWAPDMQAAIAQRIAMAQQREHYMAFYRPLIQWQLFAAFKIACLHPNVLLEFMQRVIEVLPYHFSRFRHNGKWKKRF